MGYLPTSTVGESYTRCKLVSIDNSFGQAPSVHFVEQTVSIAEDGVSACDTGRMVIGFQPEKEIALLDVTTGSPTGEIKTYADVYQAIFSVYIAEAAIRDSQ